MEKRIAIIGAGISGLLACKYVVSRGFNPIVFEEQENVGGLWNHTIESTKLQNARPSYEFSDFPWPSTVEEMFPTNFQVLEYLQSYAHNFKLLPYIKFNSRVINIDYVGESEEEMRAWELWGGAGKAFGSKGKWILNVFNKSGLPNMPKFLARNGPEMFSGKVLHSMDYAAMDNAAAAEFIKDKRVVVVGSGKSAIDITLECANANGIDNPCTMIQRSPHWALPDPHPWGVHFALFTSNRFSELTIHKPGEGFLSSALATSLKPLRWSMSKFVESYIRWKLPLKKYGMVPKEGFLQEVFGCQFFMLPKTFYDKVENGSIVLKKSGNMSFCKEGLIIDGDNDHPIQADVVIFATGYKGDEKMKNIFASPTFQSYINNAGAPSSSIPLYRQMIHPRIPQLVTIGYSDSGSNLFTFEMRCKWVAFFLDEAFRLPSIKAMEKEREEWDKYMKTYATIDDPSRRECFFGLHIWYIDQLCKDIGCNPKRKKGFFSELFQPYLVTDYNGIAPISH